MLRFVISSWNWFISELFYCTVPYLHHLVEHCFRLQDYKHRLATMAEEVARLAKSTTSMEETLAELQETHEYVVLSIDYTNL